MNGVNQLDLELSELKGFIAELKADRAAQKEKERREAWTKYTSLSLVFIAVLTAIATQWAGKYSSRVLVNLNDATYFQAQASDQWGYYQAKSIKQNLYETAAQTAGGAEAAAKAAGFKDKVAKYQAEEKEVMEKARKLEQSRDAARDAAKVANMHSGGMGSAIAIFQLSVALSSICLVTKKRPLWYLSLLFGGFAAFQMVRVWMT